MSEKDTTYLKYKGYIGSIEFSEEDNYLHGKVQGLNRVTILYEGNTIEELKKDFEEAIEDYLELCHDRDRQPQISTLS